MATVRHAIHVTRGEPTGVTQPMVTEYIRELAVGDKRGVSMNEFTEGLAHQSFVIRGGGKGQIEFVRELASKLSETAQQPKCTTVSIDRESTMIRIHRPIQSTHTKWVVIELIVIVGAFILSMYVLDDQQAIEFVMRMSTDYVHT